MKIEKLVGEGSYGSVYRGRWKGKVVAVKMISADVTRDAFDDFIGELSLMSDLRHPNIVLFMAAVLPVQSGAAAFKPNSRPAIISEFLPLDLFEA